MATFDILGKYQYMALTTFRKNGAPVKTPVWFARDGDRIYVFTDPGSGKVKRIRNNPHVTITPCNYAGKPFTTETATGQARILPESEWLNANAQLAKKYGLLYRMFRRFELLRGAKETFLEIRAT
jgi:hypothetical protein